jgi:hypothetical protein
MRNIGNTCFAAAALRALWSAEPIRRALPLSDIGRRVFALMSRPAAAMQAGSECHWPELVAELRGLIGSCHGEPHDCHELICAIAERAGLLGTLSVTHATQVSCGACGLVVSTDRQELAYAVCQPSASVREGIAASEAPAATGGAIDCPSCERRTPAVVAHRMRGCPPALVVRVSGVPGGGIERLLSFSGSRYHLRCVVSLASGHYTAWEPSEGDRGGWTVHDDGAQTRPGPGRDPPGAHTAVYQLGSTPRNFSVR